MSAVIEPRWTFIVAPLTARIPPKRLTTLSASKMAPFFAGAAGWSLTEDHLLLLAEHALRAERHEQDQHQADDREPQRGCLVVVLEYLDEPGPLQDRPEDHRADD